MQRIWPVAVLLAVGACAGTGEQSAGDVPVSTSTSTSAPVDAAGIPRGETPEEIFQAVLEDLSRRLGAEPERHTIIRDEAATWNDGSLGCAEPGVEYTQAPVRGYWIVLEVEGREYDYRSDLNGNLVFCAAPGPGGAPSG